MCAASWMCVVYAAGKINLQLQVDSAISAAGKSNDWRCIWKGKPAMQCRRATDSILLVRCYPCPSMLLQTSKTIAASRILRQMQAATGVT